ncbi:hypothetical protein MSG28_000743 [Choristoneura fumiferana]|uniref:Uncharacterized protein n=1 Tax=Choristoneura fumiferana TaxID=7141 RepID=A0ACC0K278_CHOFU|nr:hypothetical protein MSG28_000743 [Choristoneura fumiferana]
MALTIIRAARQRQVGAAITYCCRVFYSSSTTITKGKFFTKKHEWISVNDNIGTVGISNYAQEALGEVVFAQLPAPGSELVAGEECAALESVKAASEVYTPVSGIITEKNTAVEASPSTINASCYDEGWLFRVRLTRLEELQQLMTAAAYNEFLKDATNH